MCILFILFFCVARFYLYKYNIKTRISLVYLQPSMSTLKKNDIILNFENVVWQKLNKYYGKHKKDYQVNRHVNNLQNELKSIDVFHKDYIKQSAQIAASSDSQRVAVFLIKDLFSSELTTGRLVVGIYFIIKLCKGYITLKKEENIRYIIDKTKSLLSRNAILHNIDSDLTLTDKALRLSLFIFSIGLAVLSVYSTI